MRRMINRYDWNDLWSWRKFSEKKNPFSEIFMFHNLIKCYFIKWLKRHSNKYLNTYWKFGYNIFGYNYLVIIHFLLYDYKINIYVKK